jgi:hypothetical protein
MMTALAAIQLHLPRPVVRERQTGGNGAAQATAPAC